MQGLDLGTYFKYTGMTLETMREQLRPQAESFVKTRLALEKIADLEGLTATEEQIEAEYARLAEAYQMETDKVKEMIPAESVAEDLRVKVLWSWSRPMPLLLHRQSNNFTFSNVATATSSDSCCRGQALCPHRGNSFNPLRCTQMPVDSYNT